MTDTTREKIKQVLGTMVDRNRYVFWYDKGGQMKDYQLEDLYWQEVENTFGYKDNPSIKDLLIVFFMNDLNRNLASGTTSSPTPSNSASTVRAMTVRKENKSTSLCSSANCRS